jgi:hypothetical protein
MIFIVGAAVALPHWEKGWQWNCDPNRESATGVASYNGLRDLASFRHGGYSRG